MPHEPLPMMTTFNRIGTCNRFCGRCCSLQHWTTQYPDRTASLFQDPPFIGMNEQGDCLHLRWVNGQAQCNIYETRPDLCRTFPNHPLSVETIPSCTFRFVATVGTSAEAEAEGGQQETVGTCG